MNDAAIQLKPMQNLREVIRYRLSEQPFYGSTRLGVRNLERNAVYANYLFEKKHQLAEPEDPTHPLLVAPPKPQGDLANPLIPQPEYSLTLGYKQYELTNHLGNVQVTLSDKKLGLVQNENSSFSSYTADVLSAVDYYPFGMAMPGRSGDGGYRYGFNGKEGDREVKGERNSIDFGARIYDPRLGRWLSIDSLFRKYPSINGYAGLGNNPIIFTDPGGDTLRLGGNINLALIDLKSMVHVRLREAIKKTSNNQVYIDVSSLPFELILPDAGYSLLNELIASKYNYEYKVADDNNGNKLESGNNTIENNSITPKFEWFKSSDNLPSGIHGQVIIAKNVNFTSLDGKEENRASVVFHELEENF